MRLYTCHIDNFGCLRDLDLDFREKLHTVLEDNGWGKSTLAAFLLVMFYGFANEKSRSDLVNERHRYAPWQQGVYGGSVTFSRDGRILRLERVFGLKNASEDSAAVYDAETNLPVSGLPADLGETVFAIDRESFARTVFIAQQDCGTEATSGIQAKIGHLEGESADMADYHQVQAALKKMTDKLTPDRKTGEIWRIRQEMAELEHQIAGRPASEQTLKQLEKQLDGQALERQRLLGEAEELQKELRQLSAIRQTADDLTMEEEERQRLRDLEMTFSSGTPEERQMEEAEACLREIRAMRRAFDKAQRELYDPNADREEQPQRRGTSLAGMIVFALFASALLAFFMNRAAAAALAVLAVVIMIVVLKKDRQKEKEEGPVKPVVVVRQKTSPIDRVTDLRTKREQLKTKRKEIQEAETELTEFLRQFYPDLTDEDDLSRKLQQLQYERTEYLSLLKKQKKAAEAEAVWKESVRGTWTASGETTEEDGTLSFDDPEQLVAEVKEKIEATEENMTAVRRQIETVREELEHIAVAEERLALLQEQRDEAQHRYDVLDSTRTRLALARSSFTARYMEPVRQAFDRYYRLLTGEDAMDYQLDADLKIGIREYGLVRDPSFQSEGWQDLIGLCRRMAMIDTMYEGEKPFLVFDDPFVNLDGKKLQRAMSFLRQIAEKYQVIYFTCHESRVPSSVR